MGSILCGEAPESVEPVEEYDHICVKQMGSDGRQVNISAYNHSLTTYVLHKSNPAFIPIFERLELDKVFLFKLTPKTKYCHDRIVIDIMPAVVYRIELTITGFIDITNMEYYKLQTLGKRIEPYHWEIIAPERYTSTGIHAIIATDIQKSELRPGVNHLLVTSADRYLSRRHKIIEICATSKNEYCGRG